MKASPAMKRFGVYLVICATCQVLYYIWHIWVVVFDLKPTADAAMLDPRFAFFLAAGFVTRSVVIALVLECLLAILLMAFGMGFATGARPSYVVSLYLVAELISGGPLVLYLAISLISGVGEYTPAGMPLVLQLTMLIVYTIVPVMWAGYLLYALKNTPEGRP